MDSHIEGHFEHDHGSLEEESTADLMRDAAAELEHLIKSEMAIAKRELRESARTVAGSSIYFGVGGVVGFVGFMALTTCAIAALALALPLWASALIIGGGYVIIAAAAFVVGREKFKQVDAPQLKHHLQEDQQWLKTTVERMKTSRENAHA